MGLGDTKIAEQQRDRFGRHRRSPVGVDGQLVTGDALLGDRVGEEPFSKVGPFGAGQQDRARLQPRSSVLGDIAQIQECSGTASR
jgi:hypothetical protein